MQAVKQAHRSDAKRANLNETRAVGRFSAPHTCILASSAALEQELTLQKDVCGAGSVGETRGHTQRSAGRTTAGSWSRDRYGQDTSRDDYNAKQPLCF